MPLYEYKCPEHGRFDRLEPYRPTGVDSNDYVAPCPVCNEFGLGVIATPRKPLIATPFTTYGHDGSITGQTQTTERTPMKVRSRSGKEINL